MRTAPSDALSLLSWLWRPGDVRELRVLGRWTQGGYYDNPKDLAAAAVNLSANPDARGVYSTINPCLADLMGRANRRVKQAKAGELTDDKHVTARRVLLVDCDPRRPSGINSTDAEHQAALDQAETIRAELTAAGWPKPARVDTGNGAALYYLLDLPADDGELVHRCLQALAARHDNERVHIDTAVANPARIARVPGTLNRKGDNLPDRPQRLCQLLALPTERVAVPRELLEALAATLPSPTRAERTQSPPAAGRLDRVDRARRYLLQREPAIEGSGGDHWTYVTACAVTRGFELSDDEALEALRPWNDRCVPSWPESDLLGKIANARAYGEEPMGYLLDAAPPERPEPVSPIGDKPAPPAPDCDRWVSAPVVLAELLERFRKGTQRDGFVRTGLHWLDNLTQGFGPGHLVLLGARPGEGKSAFALQAAAHVSLHHGPVLYLSLEMSNYEQGGRLVQQVCQIGSDDVTAERIASMLNNFPRLYLCDQGAMLEEVQGLADSFRREHPDAALVVVDYLGLVRPRSGMTSSYERVSLVVRELKMLAQRLNLPLLALAQLSRPKSGDERPPGLTDLRDSGELEQAANKVLLIHRRGVTTPGPRTVELILAKNREGAQGSVELHWQPATLSFHTINPKPANGKPTNGVQREPLAEEFLLP